MARGALLVAGLAAALGCAAGPGSYDLVIANGRVIDPESGLDGVRYLGITDGSVAAISERPLAGHDTIDASGLVVSPGFIDIHSHSIPTDGQPWQVRDGVTTALELEEGTSAVADWLARLEGRSLINFGTSAGHIPTRIAVYQNARTLAEAEEWRGRGEGATPPAWSHTPSTPERMAEIEKAIEAGIDQGGLGVGFEVNESPGASREEILMLFRLAQRKGVPVYAHLRFMGVDPIQGSLSGAQEVIANAVATGASTHFVHLGSSGTASAKQIVEMIESVRARGFDVTGEVYPYTAASTGIQTGLFEGDWRARLGIDYGDIEWPPTGERLTAASFERFRRQGGAVIIHIMKDENVDFLVGREGVMIASDAMPLPDGRGHPRGVGTFARVLGRYVRERKALDLTDAIRKMTLLPAERVRTAAPAMANKGRIRVGADADITIFDPETVIDRATFETPGQPSAGIPFVIVNGTVVVRNGDLVAGVAPGRAITRAKASTSP